MLPFNKLATCEVEGYNLMEDAKAAIVRLAGGQPMKEATLREFGQLRMGVVPPFLDDVCSALVERTTLDDGCVQLQPASLRRSFWTVHMFQQLPMMATAAGRLLSAHVTSCATERNWSQFGSIFTKTKNRLALKRAHKIAYVRSNNSKGATRADEEVMLSVADVADEEEGEEEQVMEMDE